MKKRFGLCLCCLMLTALLMGMLVVPASAAEAGGRFVLVAEAGGRLIVAPEYISYAAGDNIKEALGNSVHNFTGLEQGIVTAIDDISGSFTRSDQNGSYDLTIPASSVTHYRFSESSGNSQPSEGLMILMTAMADYLEKEEDVRNAAKDAYKRAYSAFVGITSENAKLYAQELNRSISDYEKTLNGTKYMISFTNDGKACSEANFSGIRITAVNTFGKCWEDENQDGKLELPAGSYAFHVEYNGLHAEGQIQVAENKSLTISLPANEQWLNTESFLLSGGYDTDKEQQFDDLMLTMGNWNSRKLTVPVLDSFSGAVYSYAEFNKTLFTNDNPPILTAVYTMKNDAGSAVEKNVPFESKASGAYSVLAAEAQGNTVIYRISSQGSDGYTYAQDFTVQFERIPTLTAVFIKDQEGTDQAATDVFRSNVMEYDFNVLNTVTSVTVSAVPMAEQYEVSVQGADSENKVTISGDTQIKVVVVANGYSNTYTLNIRPGAASTLNFTSEASVTVEVVNQNGVVMPYTTHKETATKNRYQYMLVPGAQYSYIATKNTYYHIASEFKLEEVTNRTISIDFGSMNDWLADLSFGTSKSGDDKGTISLSPEFQSGTHCYQTNLVDTLHNAYIWVKSNESDLTVQAIYDQIHSSSLYHGATLTKSLKSGNEIGTQLNRFLMKNNPYENQVIIRLSRKEDGVTYYQDYVTQFKRSLTLKDITAQCDGVDTVLLQPDQKVGFTSLCKEYNVTVSMAAKELALFPVSYSDDLSYGEKSVGYVITVDGQEVVSGAPAVIELDGTINTQKVIISVANPKSPQGATEYLVNIQKSPPVNVAFQIEPSSALLNITEKLSGSRLWPDETNHVQLCEDYSYDYTLTQYGYVGISGTLEVTRNEQKELVIINGDVVYKVAETDGAGAVDIVWTLDKAPENTAINSSLSAMWPSFRGNSENNAVSKAPIPTVAEEATLYWAKQIGSGYDSNAVGSPIVVDGDLVTYSGDQIFRIDTMTGKIRVTGQMDHKSSFSITPPTYWGGMIFVALSDGSVQAFNAETLESLWLYRDPLAGQPNCPITVEDGYLYTGFWNSETGMANFVCLSVTDENPYVSNEPKCASWYYTSKGGYYWAGAWAGNGYVLVGTDDGTNHVNSQTARLLVLDAKTGKLCDSWNNLNGDIRSSIVKDQSWYYFTSKGGSFYGVQLSADGTLENGWSVILDNGSGNVPMSTSSPSVYNGRAYIGVCGAGQFSSYSGHNISVIDLNNRRIAYSVPTQGYPQTSGLLTTAYDFGNGEVYVYFFDNDDPGKLRVLRDHPGQNEPEYTTVERNREVAYNLFTPTGEHAQYAICSPIVDEYGTVYFKNDSSYLMAFGSAVEKIELTIQPAKMVYTEGESFNPQGMQVIATYENGLSRDVTEYVVCGDKVLTEKDPLVTISFPYGLYHNAPSEETTGAMVSGVVTTTPTIELKVTVKGGKLGDVNSDDVIDAKDAQRILDFEAKQKDVGVLPSVADVSGDGDVDSNDAVLILQYAQKKITKFPAETAAQAESGEDTGNTEPQT